MKKISEIVKPYISIIFGALLLLFYLNFLRGSGTTLAIGIIAVTLSAYYIGIGIAFILLGDKLASSLRKTFGIISGSLFPLLMFIIFLFALIDGVKGMGPTAWVISIISLVSSIGLAILLLLTLAVDDKNLKKIASLFAAIFLLALLLNVLFYPNGSPILLGDINILEVVIYVSYISMLLNTVSKDVAPAVSEAQVEPTPEEAPAIEEAKEEKPEEDKAE